MDGIAGGDESGTTLPPLGWDLHWTEEVGVCLESDICEERFLELIKLLTKLPRRRADGDSHGRAWVGVRCGDGVFVCVGGGERAKGEGETQKNRKKIITGHIKGYSNSVDLTVKKSKAPTFNIVILYGGVSTLDGLLHNGWQIDNTAHVRHEQMNNDHIFVAVSTKIK